MSLLELLALLLALAVGYLFVTKIVAVVSKKYLWPWKPKAPKSRLP